MRVFSLLTQRAGAELTQKTERHKQASVRRGRHAEQKSVSHNTQLKQRGLSTQSPLAPTTFQSEKHTCFQMQVPGQNPLCNCMNATCRQFSSNFPFFHKDPLGIIIIKKKNRTEVIQFLSHSTGNTLFINVPLYTADFKV